MNKGIGWMIAIAGGYLVARHFGYDPLSFLSTAGGNSVPDTSTSPNNASPGALSAGTTLAQMINKLKADSVDPNSLQTVDLWNWYYNQVRGIAGPSPESLFAGADRNRKYSLSEYWNAMSSTGFSGMGVIAHHVNPYANPIANRPYGGNAHVNAFETFVVHRGE